MHEYDPKTPRFWDQGDLKNSLDRIFDICNGCRLCFNLCGSFPALFDSAEKHHDDMSKMSEEEVNKVVDECFQCKVCYEKCPYTPDQNHSYQLDFPRIVQRSLAQRVREHGLPLRDRVLGDPDAIATISTGAVAPIVNKLNEAAAHRAILEKFLGISSKKKLPKFATKRYSSIHRSKRKRSIQNDVDNINNNIVYFPTCFVDYNAPHIGKAAAAVFEHHDFSVTCSSGTCCGMPKWANGDIDGATEQAAGVVRDLYDRAKSGMKIIVTNPTCSMHLKDEIPLLLGTDESKVVAAQTRDLGQFLLELQRAKRLKMDFKNPIGKVAYHVPCHLRAQKIGQPVEQLLIKAGAEVESVRACSGHDGTWSMKTENFDNSLKWGDSCFKGMKSASVNEAGGAAQCVSDCPLAAIQIEQATGLKVKHPIELIANAYGIDIK